MNSPRSGADRGEQYHSKHIFLIVEVFHIRGGLQSGRLPQSTTVEHHLSSIGCHLLQSLAGNKLCCSDILTIYKLDISC